MDIDIKPNPPFWSVMGQSLSLGTALILTLLACSYFVIKLALSEDWLKLLALLLAYQILIPITVNDFRAALRE